MSWVEDEDEPDLSEIAFSSVLPASAGLSDRSLQSLSGDASLAKPAYQSELTARVAEAWITPLSALTCSQVCMLVGQRFGLAWLAEPVLAFVRHAPQAQTRFYPGDLTLSAIKAHEDLLRHAPQETRRWLAGDFDWMETTFAFNRKLPAEAADALSRARLAAGAP